MNQKALTRIQKNIKTKEKELDLSFCYLKEQELKLLGKCTHLIELNLAYNQLTDITPLSNLENLNFLDLAYNQLIDIASLSNLQNLTELNLAHNQLTDIAPLSNLENLTSLDLTNNQPTNIAPLSNLENLTSLDLANNQLTDIASLSNLQNLTELNLANNQLTDIAPLSNLENLTSLDLDSNQLTDIAPLSNLENLNFLDLANNQLTDIAPLSNLENLNFLDLANNQLIDTTLDFLKSLENLESLYLFNNPIETIPVEVFNQENEDVFQKVKDYLTSIEDNSQELNEAKLIFVGVGEVGKSELADALSEPNYIFDAQRETTKGIRVKPWLLPNCEREGKKIDFTANIWDFAGQEINYGTHQYFLTKNSVYVFVWDSRKEEENSDFEYWLNIVNLLSDAAPIFMVQNKVDIYETEINRRRWKEAFLNIVDFYKTSCATGVGIEELRKVLSQEMLALPSTREKWNPNRFEVRKRLEQDKRDYIPYQEYLRICRKHELSKEEAEFLGQQLHDIGVILSFRQDFILKNTVVLNTEWATKASYDLLNHPSVKEGKFQESNLEDIWEAARFDGQHPFLLRLMEKFKLVFRLKNSDTYIIPRLLPVDTPAHYSIHPSQEKLLRLELHYKFMPKDILSQFICSVNPIIKEELFWRYGVVLSYEKNTEAEVSLNDVGAIKVISIRVWGEEADKLLVIIRQELQVIHKKLNNPSFQELIPCSCAKDKAFGKPNLFQNEVLQRRKKKGINHFLCDKCDEEVSIATLLDGIIEEASDELASLYKLIDENDMATFYERIEEMQISDPFINKLKKEYVHGGVNFEHPQRLKIGLMDYFKDNKKLKDRLGLDSKIMKGK